MAFVLIPTVADLETEALGYQVGTGIIDAGPCLLESSHYIWPEESLYSENRQLYLRDINQVAGSINWLPVTTAAGMGVRGDPDILIGMVDTGMSQFRGGGGFSHPELGNFDFMAQDRFFFGPNFDVRGNDWGDGFVEISGHGTAVASLLAAVDHTGAEGNYDGDFGIDEDAENYGMIGVDSRSRIIMATISENNPGIVNTNANLDMGVIHLFLQEGCNIVECAYGFSNEDNIWDMVFAFYAVFDGSPHIPNPNPPLCIFPTRNDGNGENVLFPARYANIEGDAYNYVISVGGSTIASELWGGSCFDTDDWRVRLVAPAQNISFANSRWWMNSVEWGAASGTSASAPIVAGAAGLVTAKMLEGGRTPTA